LCAALGDAAFGWRSAFSAAINLPQEGFSP
jgi:hypothetical protein